MKKFDIKYLIVLILIGVISYFYYASRANNTISSTEGVYKANIEKPVTSKITGQGNYALDCSTNKYTNITIGGSLIPESSIKVSEGNEKQVLYIEGAKAKYFGAEYDVVQDDESYLIIMRTYSVSGLTEVISINKELGIGFDTNTKSLGLSGAPTSDTYLTSCYQI